MTGTKPGTEDTTEQRHSNPLQYSCLGNPLDRGAWRAIVHEVTRVGHDLLTKQQQEQQVIRLRHRFLSGRVTNNSVQWE